ncbi:hypothetical protein PsorP6_012502 [Peronosclerospora sorghi]|uniref:Uncharacterized protein n=1 Tax=Peronosclerospora sorghi TaxID=230839 RepID=A0ACC0WGZ8_9STRA|nr:hypothetical protein PsorP6_012502 [Peronosclerospora sorghi]
MCIKVVQSLLRHGEAPRVFQRGCSRFVCSAAPPAPPAKGPPFARYFWYTTALMLGLPGAMCGVFVYNLQTDDEFYKHFNDRYPDLIKAISEYVPLNEKLLELSRRDDIGPLGSTEDLMNETVTVIVDLQSRQHVTLEVSGSASQREIEALALQQSADPEHDRVLAVTFAEEDENDGMRSTPSALEAWPPAPRVTWGSATAALKKNKPPAEAANALCRELEAIRTEQAALEESKFAGREIDEADEKIAALEERKRELKKQLPRKRFLWIF